MSDLQSLLDRYPDGDKWRIDALEPEDFADGRRCLFLQMQCVDDGESCGWSSEEGVTVDPDNPWVVTWNLNGEMARFSTRNDAVAYVVDFVNRYEATTDIWTRDQVSLLHVKSDADAEVVFHAELGGNLPPDEAKWGEFDDETRERAAAEYARFAEAMSR